jgi:hypothetical protein
MRTGKERSSEIKGDLQITCMLPHSMIPLIYLLALWGKSCRTGAFTINYDRQSKGPILRESIRRSCDHMAQGNEFVWFFGVQQLFDLLVNIQHATFMQDRPGACFAPNPTTSKPCKTIMRATHQRETRKANSLWALLSLLGGSTTGLGSSALLLLLLGKLDGGGTGDGGGAKVGAVSTLGGGVHDALVDLAAGGVGGERGSDLGLRGLVAARGELGGEANGVGGVGVDTDGLREVMLGFTAGCWIESCGDCAYLLVDEALPLARVTVGQVERVAGKLNAVALGEVSVVTTCDCKGSNQFMSPSIQRAYALIMSFCSGASCL